MNRRAASLAGAPLVWLAHFTAVYGVASVLCAAATPEAAAQTFWAVTLLTVLGLALAALGLVRNWRRLRGAPEAQAFLVRTNMLLYGIAAIGMLWVALPGLLLPACT